jgi:hypothetical protein
LDGLPLLGDRYRRLEMPYLNQVREDLLRVKTVQKERIIQVIEELGETGIRCAPRVCVAQ